LNINLILLTMAERAKSQHVAIFCRLSTIYTLAGGVTAGTTALDCLRVAALLHAR
jgi:hypothetical protein